MSNVANQAECWRAGKWIHNGSSSIRDDKHVALVNGLETPDTGTVEGNTFDKRLFSQLADGDAEMLPGARQVHKLQVYHLCAILLSKLQDFSGGHISLLLLSYLGQVYALYTESRVQFHTLTFGNSA